MFDFDGKEIVFPPEIYATSERPDITIWSRVLKKVFLFELTCPAEEGIAEAAKRKESRYADLVKSINAQGTWCAELYTLEVGARGFVACSVRRCLNLLGYSNRANKTLCHELSFIAARCSYALYLARDSSWNPPPLLHPELVSLPGDSEKFG